MSFADYSNTAEDHQSFLILIRQTGNQIDIKTFNRVWDRIRKLRCLKVPGNDRKIWLRFKRAYAVENNEWGDFQAHRKVLGLLSVGHCKTHTEFDSLFKTYVKVKEEYSNTIFNSRLIVFGLNRDGTPLQENDQINGKDKDSPVSESENESVDGNSKSAKFTLGDVSPSSSFGSEDDIPELSEKQNDGMASENVKVPLAKAESSDSLSLEKSGSSVNEQASIVDRNGSKTAQNKTNRNANNAAEKGDGDKGGGTTGRPHSNSLSKDSSGAEVVFYPNTDLCEDLENRLQEFAASLFFVLDSKRLDRSFERSDKMQLLCTPFEKKDYIGVDTDTRSFKRRCQGRLRKHLADLSLQAGLPGEAIMHYQTALDMLKSVNDWLWIGACYEGLSSASVILSYPQMEVAAFKRNFSFSTKRAVSMNDTKHKSSVSGSGSTSFPNGVDITRETKSGVNPDDIIDKYKEALANYSKYKQAGIIEMEASLKACRVLISQQKFLSASDFLQNVVYINVPSTEEDKVQKYSALATLYTQIGFHRKASFFKRIAAMQCVAPQVVKPAWSLCHKLLLQALDGFNISLDPKEFLNGSGSSGWPLLQLRVLNEMGYSAKKMANHQLIVRHEAFLLHTMLDHLSPAERRQSTLNLESFTAMCEGTTSQPLALENGMILPPVPLTRLPTVRCFKPMALAPHLHPVKVIPKTPVMEVKSDSPFIYSPFVQNNNKKNTDESTPNTGKIVTDFQWAVGDVCEITLQVYNPLSDELKIDQMGLITDGAEFETFPASPTLAAESGPCLVKLMGTPKSSGELNILGYTTHVFGVRSICRLKDIPHLECNSFQIEVTPSLPQLQLITSLPKAGSFFSAPEGANIVTSATTTLFAGQSAECSITLQNIGTLPVDTVEISLEDKYNTGILESVFTWNKENISSQLPLQPGAIGCFTLYLHGTSDFISNQSTDEEMVLSPVRSFWGLKNVRANTVTSQDGSSSDTVCLETLLRVEYSGGEGLECGYCRHSSVALSLDIQPALAFCKWDVLPADSAEMCYLVLDGRNETNHIMTVTYDKDMTISIEGNQVRRFAVLQRRIDFSSTSLAGPSGDSGSTLGNKPSSSQSADQGSLKYSSVISSYVDIHWTIPMLNISGKASVEQLSWSPRQLELLHISPLQWDVRLNSSSYDASGVCVSAGELVNVQVQVSSRTDIAGLSDSILSIRCYQDNSDCNHTYTLPEKVIAIGTNVLPLSEVSCDKSYKHDCDFIFLAEGKYCLEIKCLFVSLQEADGIKNFYELDKWTLSPPPQVVVGKNHLDFVADETDSVMRVEGQKSRSSSESKSSEGTVSEVMDPVLCIEGETIHLDKVLCNEENFQPLTPEVAT